MYKITFSPIDIRHSTYKSQIILSTHFNLFLLRYIRESLLCMCIWIIHWFTSVMWCVNRCNRNVSIFFFANVNFQIFLVDGWSKYKWYLKIHSIHTLNKNRLSPIAWNKFFIYKLRYDGIYIYYTVLNGLLFCFIIYAFTSR